MSRSGGIVEIRDHYLFSLASFYMNDEQETYYCIYCHDDHKVSQFAELYPNCYSRTYGEDPVTTTLDQYIERCKQLGAI